MLMAEITRDSVVAPKRSSRQPLRLRYWIGRALILATLTFGAIIFAAPFLWLVSSSLKEPAKIWLFPPQWIPNPVRIANFTEALTRVPFGLYAINTLKIVGLNLAGTLFSTSLAAYAFARLRFPGRDLVFTILLSTLMLPWAVTMIPNYIIFK